MERLKTLWHGLDRSLRARILLPTALLFAATLGAMVMSAVGFYAADMERGQHEKAELFAGMVANGVKNTMMEGKPEAVPEVLSLLMGHRSDLESVSLINDRGEVRTSSRRELIGLRPWGDRIDRFNSPQVIKDPGGNPGTYAIVHPIRNEGACTTCHGETRRYSGWLDLRFTRRTVVA